MKEVKKGLESITLGEGVNAFISHPYANEATELTKEDVWGKYDPETHERIDSGMIVARSDEKCPHFGDKVPYKSVTVMCHQDQFEEVSYWLQYVHGGNSIVEVKEIEQDKLAIRSDYMCW